MADIQEIAFAGYADLVAQMQNKLAQAIRTGAALKVRFTDSNGSTHEYRDVYEIQRAISILQGLADDEKSPRSKGRRMISLVSQR